MAKNCTPKVRNEGSIPGQRAKIPHASRAKRTKAQNRSNFKNGPHKKKNLKKRELYNYVSWMPRKENQHYCWEKENQFQDIYFHQLLLEFLILSTYKPIILVTYLCYSTLHLSGWFTFMSLCQIVSYLRTEIVLHSSF